jgi:hypothetical protein
MEQKYLAFAARLKSRMAKLEITTNRELRARLDRAKAPVRENMVSRWMMGQSRPWGDRLEALLDILGIVNEIERNEAYGSADSANRPLDQDDVPTECTGAPPGVP